MQVVILGTGSTSGTLGVSGGVAGFLRRLEEVHHNWRKDYPHLAGLVRDCARSGEREEVIGLDRIWTRIDYYSKLKTILGSEYGPAAAVELRRAVVEAYSFSDEIERIVCLRTDFDLKAILKGIEPDDTLISFNWDTLAESVALRVLGKDLIQTPHPSADGGIRFLKPHGSLSWEHRGAHGLVEVAYQDGRRPRLWLASVHSGPEFSEPLLLGAVPIKSELLEEVQSHSGHGCVHALIAAQWRETIDAVSRASSITIVGYGFQSEDAYGRFLFEEAARRRRGTIAPIVRYYSLSHEACALKSTLEGFFGKGTCSHAGEVKPAL